MLGKAKMSYPPPGPGGHPLNYPTAHNGKFIVITALIALILELFYVALGYKYFHLNLS